MCLRTDKHESNKLVVQSVQTLYYGYIGPLKKRFNCVRLISTEYIKTLFFEIILYVV